MKKEEEIKKLKRLRMELIGKNLFLIAISNILFITGFKMTGFGFPFYRDIKKRYNVNYVSINNYHDKHVIERYVYNKELHSYRKKINKLYLKDNFYCDGNLYKRCVKVYKLGEEDNYSDVINNYSDYVDDDDIIDNYTEISNYVDDRYTSGCEVLVKYYDINKEKYIEEYESNFKNIICSVMYTTIFFISVFSYSFDFLDRNKYINYDLKQLKKIKEDE